MADTIIRETAPANGEYASPVPQHWVKTNEAGTQGSFEKTVGGRGADAVGDLSQFATPLTSAALGGAASYTQTGVDRFGTWLVAKVRHLVWTDQAGTLYVEESEDNSAWTTIATQAVSASVTTAVNWTTLSKRYYRARFVNGATPQTSFVLYQQVSGAGVQDANITGSSVTLPVGGDVAHDAADSGNPVKFGGKGNSGLPAAVAIGDRVDAWFTLNGALNVIPRDGGNTPFATVNSGQQVVTMKSGTGVEPGIGALSDAMTGNALLTAALMAGWDGGAFQRLRTANVFKPLMISGIASTATSTIWTPGANKKIRLMGLVIGTSGAGSHYLRMGTAGSGTAVIPVGLLANQSLFVDLGQGKLAVAANDVLEVYNNTAGAVSYWIAAWGTEE